MTNELTIQQARVVKALLAEGHKNHDIAALFGVNPRAVSQVRNGECYAGCEPKRDHGLTCEEVTTPKIDLIVRLRAYRRQAGY